mgnify:CR=1 FL=1|tara:strand:+ start:632 stop:1063 length:432 start_codon:yes stop_codon:yes gene_type:complete
MENFTPVSALVGGMLIGLSAVLLMLLNGRIAGISGITAGLLGGQGPLRDWSWRAAFLVGLVAAPALLSVAGRPTPDISFVTSWPGMIVAGFLVGIGTVLGNGCTSGHGVCGISRLSRRSVVATVIFMIAAVVTVFIVRHILGE